MKSIHVTDATYRTMMAMANTDGDGIANLLLDMVARELERRRQCYDAVETVRDLNRAILRA